MRWPPDPAAGSDSQGAASKNYTFKALNSFAGVCAFPIDLFFAFLLVLALIRTLLAELPPPELRRGRRRSSFVRWNLIFIVHCSLELRMQLVLTRRAPHCEDLQRTFAPYAYGLCRQLFRRPIDGGDGLGSSTSGGSSTHHTGPAASSSGDGSGSGERAQETFIEERDRDSWPGDSSPSPARLKPPAPAAELNDASWRGGEQPRSESRRESRWC